MATVFKASERDFQEHPNRIDNYRLFTDVARERKGVNPKHLNFDMRLLNPGEYSAPYHSHRYAEELFMLLSGSATLRTPEGLETVEAGDIIFFELGENGAHQLYNHTGEPCTYLDIRTYIGYDVCDYPDSNKILLFPSREIYKKETQVKYFEGEESVKEKWAGLAAKKK